jgi:hypothetical protein
MGIKISTKTCRYTRVFLAAMAKGCHFEGKLLAEEVGGTCFYVEQLCGFGGLIGMTPSGAVRMLLAI